MAALSSRSHSAATPAVCSRSCRAAGGPRCHTVRVAAQAQAASAAPRSPQAVEPSADALQYKHLLLPILDANPFLSDGSKQAVATAALFARQYKSKLTVLIVDEPGTDNTDPAKRMESIAWHLQDKGCSQYELVERATSSPASVLVGDIADELSADLVMLSSEAVHAKHVDANQLAEFVCCPVMLLP